MKGKNVEGGGTDEPRYFLRKGGKQRSMPNPDVSSNKATKYGYTSEIEGASITAIWIEREETPQKGQSALLAKGNFLAFFRMFPHHRLGRAPLFRMRVAFFQLTWISKIYLFHPTERFQIA